MESMHDEECSNSVSFTQWTFRISKFDDVGI